jgi:hypothetical protein
MNTICSTVKKAGPAGRRVPWRTPNLHRTESNSVSMKMIKLLLSSCALQAPLGLLLQAQPVITLQPADQTANQGSGPRLQRAAH